MAIAKGIEIGAYEVARPAYGNRGGHSRLQVAKSRGAVGWQGEGVMKAVNAVIQGALSFFYINRLEPYGKANRVNRIQGIH